MQTTKILKHSEILSGYTCAQIMFTLIFFCRGMLKYFPIHIFS